MKHFCHVFLFLIPAIILAFIGCNKSISPEPDYLGNTLASPATLADNIPYSLLGGGKIAFERIGPENNAYSGGYIINVDAKKSNLFMDGVVLVPSISHNGNLVSFRTLTMRSSTYYDIYVINADGTNKTRVSDFEGNTEYYPSWRPDGSIIYWVINEQLGVDIYSQKPGGESAIKIYTLPNGTGFASPISVLNSGKYLFSNSRDTSIFIYENNGISKLNINYTSLEGRTLNVESPKWSPDESAIACIITERDSSFIYHKISIIKMDSNGSSLKVLVAFNVNTHNLWAGGSDFSLCWSPDGSKILFSLPESDLLSHIYVISSDGSQISQVTTLAGVYDRSVSWSN